MPILTGESEVPVVYNYPKGEPPSVPTTWDMVSAEFSAAGYEAPFDRGVVSAIRKEIDRDFVPLAIRRTYRSSNGEGKVYEHHAVAWKIRTPHKKHHQQPVMWPSTPDHVNYGYDGSALLIEDILCGDDTPDGRPGRFYPIDSSVLMVMKAKKKAMELEPENPGELARQLIQAKQEREDKDEAAVLAEAHYRFDHDTAGASASFDEQGRFQITKTRVGYTGEKTE